MKPLLYKSTYTGQNDTNAAAKLIGTLADATSCTVTEQRNGEFELEMEYLPTGVLANKIKTGTVIMAKPAQQTNRQPFRVYRVEKTLTGTISVAAHHISYDLTKVYLKYFDDQTGITAALAAIKSNLIQQSGDTTDWNFASDITNTKSVFKHPEPTTVRAALGGMEGSLLDTFGGEFEWDNLGVFLHKARGRDRGVYVRYAGNLLEFNRTEDFENAYTHVMVYWFNDETGAKTTSLSYPVHDLVAEDFTQSRTAVIDVTDQYESQPNRATLNPVAQAYANKLTSKPTVGLEVKFVDLNSTTEGGAEAIIKLCDTIHVIDPVRDVDLKAKVIETRWNVLLDRYDDVTVGIKGKNIADTIAGLQSGGNSSYSGSGGGGGSTETDYRNLTNKPSINGVELTGDKSLSALGIASATALADVKNTADSAVQDVTVNGTSVKDGTTAKVTVPTKNSELTNDSHYITAAGAPVQSVNGKTGSVTLDIPDSTSDLTNDSGFITASDLPAATIKRLWTGTAALDSGAVLATLDEPTGFALTDGVMLLLTMEDVFAGAYVLEVVGHEQETSTTVIRQVSKNNGYTSGETYFRAGEGETILFTYHASDGVWMQSPSDWRTVRLEEFKADLASPALTGIPTAPTAATGTNTTQLATTAFVQAAIAASGGGGGGGSYGQKLWTGVCTTAAATKAKEVTLDDATGFTLAAGTFALIRFTLGNSATSPTLSFNGGDAKNLSSVTINAGVFSGSAPYHTIEANEPVLAVYNGTYWVFDNSKQNKANLKSPVFYDTPQAPTAAAGTNTKQIATTAFVQEAIAGISAGSKAYIGTCDTAATAPYKIVACDGFELETGATVYVKFTNTHSTGVLYLNVNGTGNVQVTNAGTASGMGVLWRPGEVVEFVYDGTNWLMLDHVRATTNYIGLVQLSSTVSNNETTAATPKAVKAAYDNGGVQSVTPDYSSGVKVASFATTGGTVDLYLPVYDGTVTA